MATARQNSVDPGRWLWSWNNNQMLSNPDNPGVGFAGIEPDIDSFGAFSYAREYFEFEGSTVSMFWETRTGRDASYAFSGT